MPQIQIEGVPNPVWVGPEFGQMSPDDQNAFIAHIADQAKSGTQSSLGGAPPVAASMSPQTVPTGPVADLPRQPWSGGVLPVSSDSEGNISFDPHAGILGGLLGAGKAASDLGRYAVEGGGLSQDQLAQKAFQASTLVNPVNPAVRAGDLAIPGLLKAGDRPIKYISGLLQATKPAEVSTPTRNELFGAADAGYEALRKMPVEYSLPAVKQSAGELRVKLNSKGYNDTNSPDVFKYIDQLENPPSGAIATLEGVNTARQAFGHAAGDFNNATQQGAASIAKQHLDDFITAPNPKNVVAGPAADAGQALSEANANYAAAKRSEQLGTVENKATLRAGVANSGQNLDNTIRQRIADVLLDPKKLAGYSPEEVAALHEVALGTPTRNAARLVANMLGGGSWGSVLSGAGAGAAAGSAGGLLPGLLVGAAVPTVSMTLKKATAAATTRALDRADELVRQRSPLFQGLLSQPPEFTAVSPLQRSLAARGLLAPYATNSNY